MTILHNEQLLITKNISISIIRVLKVVFNSIILLLIKACTKIFFLKRVKICQPKNKLRIPAFSMSHRDFFQAMTNHYST